MAENEGSSSKGKNAQGKTKLEGGGSSAAAGKGGSGFTERTTANSVKPKEKELVSTKVYKAVGKKFCCYCDDGGQSA